MIDQHQYSEWLLRRAIRAVDTGAATLRQIVELCEGADPLAVRAALARGNAPPGFSSPEHAMEAPQVADGPVEPSLPPPHPIDYEWRFSRRGADTLLTSARALNARDLAFMGATTVAITAGREGGWGRLLVFDRSESVASATKALGLPIEFVIADVCIHVPEVPKADVVIIDPPWYLDHARAFFLAAARECRPEGFVLASLPGRGTRPGVESERTELIQWAEEVGLQFVSIEPQCVPYETPQFERNAFRAAGLRGDLRGWRRGDLWTLKRRGAISPAACARVEPVEEWPEHAIGRMRLRFRELTTRSGDSRLVRVVEGDVLPTVSRRDPRREKVRVWTSGNRVFGCDDSGTLLAALRARSRREDHVDAGERALGRRLSDFERRWLQESCELLEDLSITEQDEHTKVTEDKRWSESVSA